MLVLADIPSAAAFGRVFVSGNVGQSQPGVQITSNFSRSALAITAGMLTFYCVSTTGGGTTSFWTDSTAGQIDGNVHCWLCRRSAGLGSIYRDGLNVTGNRTAANSQSIGGGGSASSNGFFLGGMPNSNENAGPSCTISLFVAWNRALTDGEMFSLGKDPFQLFLNTPPTYKLFADIFASSLTAGGRIPLLGVG